jgi:hypothetical protein
VDVAMEIAAAAASREVCRDGVRSCWFGMQIVDGRL